MSIDGYLAECAQAYGIPLYAGGSKKVDDMGSRVHLHKKVPHRLCDYMPTLFNSFNVI